MAIKVKAKQVEVVNEKDDLTWQDDRVDVFIYKNEGVPDPVYVAVNGHSFAIKPGVHVQIPRAVFQVLVDAKIETKEYEEIPNQPGQYTIKDVTYDRFFLQMSEIPKKESIGLDA